LASPGPAGETSTLWPGTAPVSAAHRRGLTCQRRAGFPPLGLDDFTGAARSQRARSMLPLCRIRLGRLERDLPGHAMDLGLAPRFLSYFHRRRRFASAAPSVIELAELRIGSGQIRQANACVPRHKRGAYCASQVGTERRRPSGRYFQTWHRRCGRLSPASPRTPAADRQTGARSSHASSRLP
jgi:hypothetical protein